MAIGAMRALRDMRLNVPDDVSVVGFDDIDFAQHVDPPPDDCPSTDPSQGRGGGPPASRGHPAPGAREGRASAARDPPHRAGIDRRQRDAAGFRPAGHDVDTARGAARPAERRPWTSRPVHPTGRASGRPRMSEANHASKSLTAQSRRPQSASLMVSRRRCRTSRNWSCGHRMRQIHTSQRCGHRPAGHPGSVARRSRREASDPSAASVFMRDPRRSRCNRHERPSMESSEEKKVTKRIGALLVAMIVIISACSSSGGGGASAAASAAASTRQRARRRQARCKHEASAAASPAASTEASASAGASAGASAAASNSGATLLIWADQKRAAAITPLAAQWATENGVTVKVGVVATRHPRSSRPRARPETRRTSSSGRMTSSATSSRTARSTRSRADRHIGASIRWRSRA